MHLHRLRVSNFRSLEEIDVEFDSLVNVIIGPNAIGKTTVLEAIRLAKAALAARTQNEGNQTMVALGLTSPHVPQRYFPRALTSDVTKPTRVRLAFKPETEELDRLKELLPGIAPFFVQQATGLNFANHAQAISFFSSEPGKQALHQAQNALQQGLEKVELVKCIELNLLIDYSTSTISGENPLEHALFSALERNLPPSKALFSYFPADRALPSGEQPVQLGAADTNSQLESYNSQPQLKYGRLKHTIFSSIIGGDAGRDEIKRIFDLIFDRILKGRSLGKIGLNDIGMLSIQIIDTDSGDEFDIGNTNPRKERLVGGRKTQAFSMM